jgi:hypothetical protein
VKAPTPPAKAPTPPGQEAGRCDPDNYDQILQRYRNQNGDPSADDLLKNINEAIVSVNEKIRKLNQEGYGSVFSVIANDSALKERELRNAERARDFLPGAVKLIEEMRASGKINEQALIALKLAMERALGEDGLTDRGRVASISVGLFGSDAGIIRDASPSYHDKQNALGHILSKYGADKGMWGIDDDDPLGELVELADKTARDSLIAACRAEGMGRPSNGGGGGSVGGSDDFGDCKGVRLERPQQCCTADGIGTRVTKNEDSIVACPPENRTPKRDYVPSRNRNGCGIPVTDFFFGDRPDNPNSRKIAGIRYYYGPSFYPACDFHDDCWGTCNTPETGMDQDVCDSEFGVRLKQICDSANLNWYDLMTCRKNAWFYQKGVRFGGAVTDKYDAGQAASCDCCEGGTS